MTVTTPPADALRQSDLQSLVAVLNEQRARAIDVVIPGRQIDVIGSSISLNNIPHEPSDDGVTNPNGLYTPTTIADEGIAAKLGIPIGYLRRMRADRPDLYQSNVAGWLESEDRKFLLRLFRSDDSMTGVLRAFLSDSYRVIDNIDVLMAALSGITKAGVEDPIIGADLTQRRMVVRVTVPEIAVYADKLLENYRSPFDGTDVSRGWTPDHLQRVAAREGQSLDGGSKLIFAGLVITNSEVGDGRFSITPMIEVQVCGNGLSFTADAVNKTHLGARMDEGLVKWSEETQATNLKLITEQTTDAVRTYLDVDYVTKKVAQLEAAAGEPVEDAPAVIATVSRKLAFTEDAQQQILAHFYRGGQATVFGVTQAITSVAQVVRDGDVALEMERQAVGAMQLAHEANKQLAKVK